MFKKPHPHQNLHCIHDKELSRHEEMLTFNKYARTYFQKIRQPNQVKTKSTSTEV